MGFGYTVAVTLDPDAAANNRAKGAFGWGGAFGTMSWTDPENELVAVIMLQQPHGRTQVAISRKPFGRRSSNSHVAAPCRLLPRAAGSRVPTDFCKLTKSFVNQGLAKDNRYSSLPCDAAWRCFLCRCIALTG